MTKLTQVKKKLNKLIYIEEELFEILHKFEVPINNDSNDFRKMKEELANKRNIILHHMKINMLVLTKCQRKLNIASTRQYEGIHRK